MGRLKDYSVYAINAAPVFQFHYGTIKRIFTMLQIMHLCYFNSTMGRLKVADGQIRQFPNLISIPLWDD